MTSAPRHPPDGLREQSVGLPRTLFQSITSMAPAAGVAFSLLVAVRYAGRALPLAVLLALGACLLVANAVGQLAKQIPSAGGIATYVTEALGPAWGFFAAWILLLGQPIAAPALVLVLATATQDVWPTVPWWAWVVVAFALVLAVGYRDVRLSTSVGLLLGVVEIGVFVALALWMIIARHDANTLAVFVGENGVGGTAKGMVFAILAFLGFEAAAPLGEEAADPRRTIPRAVVLSTLTIGAFYVLCSYAWVVGTGPARFTAVTTASDNPDPWRTLATAFWGPGWILIFLAVVNSAMASANAGALASTRIGYALARTGILPRALGRVHPRFRTPHVAVVAQTGWGIVVALVAGWWWGPQTGFLMLATTATVLVIVLYMLVCLGSIRFYRRRPDFHPLLHGVCPAVGLAALVAPLYVQYAAPPDPPISYASWAAVGWLLLGIGAAVWHRKTGVSGWGAPR